MNDMSSQGFRMTVGSPTSKGSQSNPGLRYTCLQDVMTRFPETADFPTKPCPAGIMAIHHFPACWDGKNLDSPNHQDHMYNTGKGGFVAAGACPSSHPIRMPQLALETMWDTTPFNDKNLWPTDGSQPFVWSYDDSKGYGTHADYLFGWKGDALQRTMDSTPLLSNGLKTQTVAQSNACTIKPSVKEDIDGCELSPDERCPLRLCLHPLLLLSLECCGLQWRISGVTMMLMMTTTMNADT